MEIEHGAYASDRGDLHRRTVLGGLLAASSIGLWLLPTTAMAAATTRATITYQGLLAPFHNATLLIDLRQDGAYWWARARFNDGNSGAANVNLGTLKIQLRERAYGEPWAAWVTKKTKVLSADDTSVTTDSKYNPPNSNSSMARQVRAAFTANTGMHSVHYPATQGTGGFEVT